MRGITIALSLDSQVIRGFEAVQKSARPLEGRIREGAGSSPASDTINTLVKRVLAILPNPFTLYCGAKSLTITETKGSSNVVLITINTMTAYTVNLDVQRRS